MPTAKFKPKRVWALVSKSGHVEYEGTPRKELKEILALPWRWDCHIERVEIVRAKK
jgi:hypothetical protein